MTDQTPLEYTIAEFKKYFELAYREWISAQISNIEPDNSEIG
jgi:hypothetical protein